MHDHASLVPRPSALWLHPPEVCCASLALNSSAILPVGGVSGVGPGNKAMVMQH